jgi:predicted nuclease of predicted toxin-antitoxin system
MKFLLDQGLPREAVDALRRLGHEAEHVSAIGMHAADDGAILKSAMARGELVVTLDADFHAILSLGNASGPSTIRIRIEGLREHELAGLLHRVSVLCAKELHTGAMVSVDAAGVRVRSLPLR